MTRQIKIIGCAFGFGAQIKETESGPEAIRAILPASLQERYEEISPNPEYKALEGVVNFCARLSHATKRAIEAGQFPIILGGDHSIAVGSWGGIAKAVGEIGLIWIDAHMDSHTYETSPSKAYHGMPLAALLGYGDAALVSIGAKLNPKHVTIVGARSYEPEEEALLKRLGVRIFYADEVHKRGIKAVLEDAKAIAIQAKDGFGVSLDLDFFDPADAPGVGSPEPKGFMPDEFMAALPVLLDPHLKGFEVVELNPHRDEKGKTARIASGIVEAVIG